MEEINCKLCGSNQKKIILTNCQDYLEKSPGKFTIVQCKRCKLTYLNPRPTMEELASCYSSGYYAYQKPNLTKIEKRLAKLNHSPFKDILKERFHYTSAQSHSFFKKILLRFLFLFCRPLFRGVLQFQGSGRILDIGCGSGLHLWFLKNLGWQVWGLEISSQAAQVAQSLGVNVFCGELTQANFPSQYFDIIRMNHVIEHLPRPAAYLKEIKRLLKPAGDCLIRTPNIRSLNYLIFKKYWRGLEAPRHLYLFSPATLKRLLHRLDFQIKKTRYVASSGTFLASLNFLLQAKGWASQPWARFLLTNKGLQKIIFDPFCRFQNFIHFSDEIETTCQISPAKSHPHL